MKRVAIVGGGISGLAAAYYLGRRGIPSRLFEERPRLGGMLRTERIHGCLVEEGPDSWLAEKAWMLELVRELGLGEQVIGSRDERRRTFVVRNSRLTPVPNSLRLLAPTKPWQIATTRLLGLPAKLRFALEWFRRPIHLEDRSVAEFVLDHFGGETLEYLAQPMLSGVYGSPPERLSANHAIPRMVDYERRYGSVVRGTYKNRHGQGRRPLFQTLRHGMAALAAALERAIEGNCEVVRERVLGVGRSAGTWNVRCADGSFTSDEIVLATPTYEAARVLAATDSELAEELDRIVYTSSVVAALVYPAEHFGHSLDGFGLLVPRAEQGSLAACTWVNTKFASRSPADRILLRAFLAGDSAERAMAEAEESVLRAADTELRAWMGIRVAPLGGRVQRWKRSMPQYAVGHAERVRRIGERARRLPGLHLAGNGYSGLGIPDCVKRSRRIAEEIADRRRV